MKEDTIRKDFEDGKCIFFFDKKPPKWLVNDDKLYSFVATLKFFVRGRDIDWQQECFEVVMPSFLATKLKVPSWRVSICRDEAFERWHKDAVAHFWCREMESNFGDMYFEGRFETNVCVLMKDANDHGDLYNRAKRIESVKS